MPLSDPVIYGVSALLGLSASARWNWWRLPSHGLPILMYHKVGIAPASSQLKKLWVSPAQFRAQLDYLSGHGYQSLTFIELKKLMEEKKPVPSNAVILTFDDGYQNNYTEAFPLMREKGFCGVIFLVVESIGGDNRWHDPGTELRIPMLTWTQVEEMRKAGFEFGSHTMTHRNLERLNLEEAAKEISESRQALKYRLGAEPISFAYPYGAGEDDARIRERVREAGYTFGIGIHKGKSDPSADLFCLKRIFVRGDDSMLDFHLNMTRGQARL